MSIDTVAAADPAPLDDAELDRLDRLLAEAGGDDAMIVEELDGFLAALACAPERVSEADLLPVALGRDAAPPATGQPVPVDETLVSLVRRHAGAVSAALDRRDFAPVLAYDDRGRVDGSAWAVGFLRAVEMAPDSWDAMLDEKEFGDALDAIEALAATLDDGAGTRKPSRRERDALIEQMIGDVADIHEFFRPYRRAGTTPQAMRVETVRRAQPKVGRNDPCPCGSGRKFKACCGAG